MKTEEKCLVAVNLIDAEVISRVWRLKQVVEDEERARMLHKLKGVKMGGLN